MKKCSKCKQVKTLLDFHRDSTRKDGRACVCKECKKQYYIENRDHLIKVAAKWNREHPEKAAEHVRRYWQRHQSKLRYKERQKRRTNPEKARAAGRRTYRRNKGQYAIRRMRRRARKMNAEGEYTPHQFKRLCAQYNNRCLRCGKKKKLTADHVIPLVSGGSNDISNIQPLCKPCNSSKGTKTTDYRTKPGILRYIQKKLL